MLTKIFQRLEDNWVTSGVDPDFISFMRRALFPDKGKNATSDEHSSRWALLPGLCCQAAGGDLHWADDIAAAWLLFYVAADLMDTVEDNDEPDAWWAELGPGFALNVASGLFFSASNSLNRLHFQLQTHNAAAVIADDFNRSFLQMCNGQHADLIHFEPTLEQYWEIVEMKSGEFFALACRSGARLATSDKEKLNLYAEIGKNLGMIVQILDDLQEFQPRSYMDGPPDLTRLIHSLPVIYSLAVLPEETRIRLRKLLRESRQDPQAAQQAWDLVDDSGAAMYLIVELERYRSQALAALQAVQPLAPAAEKLASLIPEFNFKNL